MKLIYNLSTHDHLPDQRAKPVIQVSNLDIDYYFSYYNYCRDFNCSIPGMIRIGVL